MSVDRSGWGPGPWDGEGDRYEWTDESTGMPCLMKRNGSGAWCGYVAVNPDHPLHGVGYDDAHSGRDIDVHGGLTYASLCNENAGICHVPKPGEPDNVWWFGFDCAHGGDEVPEMQPDLMAWNSLADLFGKYAAPTGQAPQYRDKAYVERQIGGLAQQLHKIGAAA